MQPVLVVVAGFTATALLLAWSRWLVGRRWAAGRNLALALVLGAAVTLGWPLAAYLDTYEVRLAERPVAEIFFERTRLPGEEVCVETVYGPNCFCPNK